MYIVGGYVGHRGGRVPIIYACVFAFYSDICTWAVRLLWAVRGLYMGCIRVLWAVRRLYMGCTCDVGCL